MSPRDEFDLVTWYRWEPVDMRCPNCHAVYSSSELNPLRWKKVTRGEQELLSCNVCKEEFGDDIHAAVDRYKNELKLQELGYVASKLPPYTRIDDMFYGHTALLAKAIQASTRFIHFLTYSIDSIMLSFLLMASSNTSVKGVIGQMNPYCKSMYESVKAEGRLSSFSRCEIAYAPQLNQVHSKLLIIDGILAFRGSTNLAVPAYAKAGNASKRELTDVVARPDEVAKLNNEYFAPIWLEETPHWLSEEDLPF